MLVDAQSEAQPDARSIRAGSTIHLSPVVQQEAREDLALEIRVRTFAGELNWL